MTWYWDGILLNCFLSPEGYKSTVPKSPMSWKRWMEFGTYPYPEAQVNTMNAQGH